MALSHPGTTVLSSTLLLLLSGCGADATTPPSQQPAQLRAVQVMTLADPVATRAHKFSGVLKSAHTTDLSFRVHGMLQELVATEGTRVRKGELLARLDPHDFQVSVSQGEAQLAEATAAHQLARIELARIKRACADNAIADVNLDRAISGEARAHAAVKLATQGLQKARDALAYSELRAPFDGVIGKRHIDNHEFVLPGIKVLTLHQPDQLNVVIDVPERQVSRITIGQPGHLAWGQRQQDLAVTVTDIASIPSPLKRTYEVTLSLPRDQVNLVAGKSVNVTLELPQQAETPLFCLPAMAVNSQDRQWHVWRVAQDHVTRIPVSLHDQQQNTLCVSGELTAGDQLVVAGSAFVSEGEQVAIIANHSLDQVAIMANQSLEKVGKS
ncbi:efflux RND transporter periplasmic adaptor subunit [Aeromonas sobria]|nr:efflux RND transporter periplasmic adaptor subunit [Aeromonas sobria]